MPFKSFQCCRRESRRFMVSGEGAGGLDLGTALRGDRQENRAPPDVRAEDMRERTRDYDPSP